MPNRKNMNMGEVLVQYLEERGVSVVYGIPGVHTVEMCRALGCSRGMGV